MALNIDNFVVTPSSACAGVEGNFNFIYVASGGLTLGGSFAVGDFSYSAVGGLTIGGEASSDSGNSHTGVGGLTIGGVAGVETNYITSATGGLTIGGVAGVERPSYIDSATGGLIIGGEVDVGEGNSHIATGGLTIGGDADLGENSHIATGGLTISGEAVVESASYGFVATDGLTIDGEAVIESASYEFIATDGLTIGGEAATQKSSLYTATGGLIVSGEAALRENTYISSGGLTLNGEATNIQTTYITSADGGLTISGEAVIESASYEFVATDGLTIDGESTTQKSNFYTAIGGLSISGEAALRENTYISSGGLTLNGEATNIQTTYITSADGGLTISGEAVIESASYEFVATDGLTIDGESTTQKSNFYTAIGGLSISGESFTTSNFHTATGGLVLSGSASIQNSPIFDDFLITILDCASVQVGLVHDATGGLTIGGEAPSILRLSGAVTGGLILSGNAGFEIGYAALSDGGLAIGGEVDSQVNYVVFADGGLTINGVSELESSYIDSADGGLTIGGIAKIGFAVISDGGLIVGGDSELSLTVSIFTTGGLTISGEAGTESSSFTTVATGGLTIDGESNVSGEILFVADGGLTIGGEAIVPIFATGGITIGGTADSNIVISHNATGGLTIGGEVDFASFTATGGLTIGGEAGIKSTSFTVVGNGGLTIGGETLITFIFLLDQNFSWNVEQTIELDLDVTWDVGDPRWFWWRFEGQCIPRECDPFGEENLDAPTADDCPTSYVANIIARTLEEACRKLTNGNLNFVPWEVNTVKRFTRPALKSDVADLPEDDPAILCNELIDVTPTNLNNLPEPCVNLFVSETPIVEFQGFAESFELIGEHTATGGIALEDKTTVVAAGPEGNIILGGSAGESFDPSIPNLLVGGEATTLATNFFTDTEFTWNVGEQSSFNYVFSGGLTISNESETIPDLDIFTDGSMDTENEGAQFAFEEVSEFIPTTPDVAVRCCDVDFPFFINLEIDDILRTNKFSQFLQRNAITFPRPIQLTYNTINESWQSNLNYRGFSATTSSKEDWNLVFELSCINQFGITSINDAIWKFSIRIETENVTTGEDFLTRIVAIYSNSTFCPEVVINFFADIDTSLKESFPATMQPLVLCDDIGLFKGTSWVSNPIFNLRITVDQPNEFIGSTNVGDVVVPVS